MPRRSGRKPQEEPSAGVAVHGCPCSLCGGSRRSLHCAQCVSQGLLAARRRLSQLQQQAAARRKELDERLLARVSAHLGVISILHAASLVLHPACSCSSHSTQHHVGRLDCSAQHIQASSQLCSMLPQLAGWLCVHEPAVRHRLDGWSNAGSARTAAEHSARLGQRLTRQRLS